MISRTLATYSLTTDDVYDFCTRGWVYAILDGAGEPRVFAKLQSGGFDEWALFESRIDQALTEAAPHFVKMNEELILWLRETMWETPWGILVESDLGIEPLRKHLRSQLLVVGPDGKPLYFRYYDPRVLPTFLETCTDGQLDEFFGPITAFIVRTNKPDEFVRYARSDDDSADSTAVPSAVSAYRKSMLTGGRRPE